MVLVSFPLHHLFGKKGSLGINKLAENGSQNDPFKYNGVQKELAACCTPQSIIALENANRLRCVCIFGLFIVVAFFPK